jgi:hypothetical protein
VALLLALACAQAMGQSDPVEIGRRIYREGLLPSGAPLRGTGQVGVARVGADAACANCHRRSGYGAGEGSIEIRPITGPSLFGERVAPRPPSTPALGDVASAAVERPAPTPAAQAARDQAAALRAARTAALAGTRQRPPYDEATLSRAIREGVDVTGRAMDATMPRFELDAAALGALTAYLKTLSTQNSPGVTDDAVHFATVIQPGTPPAQRQALVDVLQAFLHDRNQGLLEEVQRQSAGRTAQGRRYREWVLHVWDLQGSSGSWEAQLESQYRTQPVFALLSGIGPSSWQPVHNFSEKFELPCVLPQTPLPADQGPNQYTVYIHRGVALEAEALAKHLHDQAEGAAVTQVYRRGSTGEAAALAFRKAYAGSGLGRLTDLPLDATADEALWRAHGARAAGEVLVLWLPPQDLAPAQALLAGAAAPKTVFLSATLAGEHRSGLAADQSGRVQMVWPQDTPDAREQRLVPVKRWLARHGQSMTDETVQVNAYMAATATAMVLAHGRELYSREFLLERLEHRLGTGMELTIYPRLSLGPGQRYASKGSYVLGVRGPGNDQLVRLSEWIVP